MSLAEKGAPKARALDESRRPDFVARANTGPGSQGLVDAQLHLATRARQALLDQAQHDANQDALEWGAEAAAAFRRGRGDDSLG